MRKKEKQSNLKGFEHMDRKGEWELGNVTHWAKTDEGKERGRSKMKIDWRNYELVDP